jgi:hypothetical protein
MSGEVNQMKSKLVFLLGVLLILAAAMMSCGKKQETSEAPSSTTSQVAKPVDARRPAQSPELYNSKVSHPG